MAVTANTDISIAGVSITGTGLWAPAIAADILALFNLPFNDLLFRADSGLV